MPEIVGPGFADRRAAGRELARRLSASAREDPVVVGLARGGVPVAREVARALAAPLDVLVVAKIGAPGSPELGIGAVAEGDVQVENAGLIRHLVISAQELDLAGARIAAEVAARVRRLRGGRAPIDLAGRTVIVVDDGLATGATARAALGAVRARGARHVILAVPVGAETTVAALRRRADEVVCLLAPEDLGAVGSWYENFEPTTEAEVVALLADAARAESGRVSSGSPRCRGGTRTA